MRGGKRKNAGRPAGTANKITRDARAAIEYVFNELGGADALKSWVEKDTVNERVFYAQIWPKILPKEVRAELTGKDGGPIQTAVALTDDQLASIAAGRR